MKQHTRPELPVHSKLNISISLTLTTQEINNRALLISLHVSTGVAILNLLSWSHISKMVDNVSKEKKSLNYYNCLLTDFEVLEQNCYYLFLKLSLVFYFAGPVRSLGHENYFK